MSTTNYDPKTASVNVIRVSLELASKMFRSLFLLKLQAFIKNGNGGVCGEVCF